VVEADLLYPTNVGKQLTRSALERNQAVSVRWIPGQKGACRGARESTPLQRVRHPTSVTQRQPKEESAFIRGTGFPNLQSTCHRYAPMGHAYVTGLRGIDLLGSPVPPEDIRDTHGDS
jgi:hypothetical protein